MRALSAERVPRTPGRALVAAEGVRVDAEPSGLNRSRRRWAVPSGVVKWFDPGRGLGVIAQEGGEPDAVACRSAVHDCSDRTLVEGDRVCFDVTQDSAGIRADNVHRPACELHCPPAEGSAGHTVAGLSSAPDGAPRRVFSSSRSPTSASGSACR
ncbi:cold shock domain-containing protein [Streptomyces sp. CA-210063]|uniref:cold-shock protein n=1 Tax=Streptomyces sp. CA-210063 TaxID=2801029 RepID=UPI00214D0FF7|nr:cold shock domain-containing protein [Streptomyces sp. CA-210063]UUU37213.1 cold shock domain-containing protein [Streptomyces sp. CA-210063]